MLRAVEIVVEPVFDGRADGDLNLVAIKLLDRLRHQVGGRVAIDFQPGGRIEGNQFEAGIGFQRRRQID